MRLAWRRTVLAGLVGATLAILAPTSALAVRPLLSDHKVLRIALHEAKSHGARRPRDILEATGRAKLANEVFEGESNPELRSPQTTSEELKWMGGPNALIDVVAMRGHFVADGGHAEGPILVLMIDAHSGRVDGLGLPEKYPDLARLGHVTHLP